GFRRARDDLLDGELQEWDLCRAYADLVDSFLAGVMPPVEGVALAAVGGYGRRELCPGSDIDVVLLHTRRERKDVQRVADAVWYPLWDSGLKVGHAVRTVKDALGLAAGDLETATSLLDSRLVAGDAALVEELLRRAHAQWRARSSRWLDVLADSVTARHEQAGEVAFLLEPDLKEGRGGLRDVHALRWAEAAERILLPDDHATLDAAHDVLLAARVELHRRTGKSSDILLLQEQDAVASALGEADADALMARVAAAARTVAWTSDETWDRIRSSLRGPSGRVAAADRPVGKGLVLREGVLELAPGVDPAADASIVLRAAAAAATYRTRLSRAALDRLAASAPGFGDQWPEEARQALVTLLGAGHGAVGVLEALDQKGLLVRTVPEWEAVRHRPQRNAYHRYTVDRHLCEAAAEAASLTGRVGRPDLLLVGCWLHDLGKGYAGEAGRPDDHSVAGAEVVEQLARRMGFPPHDVETLSALVRHHLLLADAATRRDLDDPATVTAVADAVGDAPTLELLHVLTEADGAATGPAAWSPWKAGLVSELVRRVRAALGGAEPVTSDFPGPDHLRLAERARAEGTAVVEVDGPSLTIAAPDRRGLFCRAAGVLSLHGLDVMAARAWSSGDGVAVEDFQVQDALGEGPDRAAVQRDLRSALTGRLSLEARLAARANAYADPRLSAAVPPRTQVTVTNDASEKATVVEVRAPDRMGTLYRITKALAEMELDIRHAKVSTMGHELVDVFYVVGASGDKLDDPAHMAEVQRAVLFELSRV
ncbi:MAG TPA: [protein-PII] uridylyltransferase, partial [Acidimicrobiales bacterium]|nr:[protein-PII] uridylyltransferase [Acidimicrobiales bacterium]